MNYNVLEGGCSRSCLDTSKSGVMDSVLSFDGRVTESGMSRWQICGLDLECFWFFGSHQAPVSPRAFDSSMIGHLSI